MSLKDLTRNLKRLLHSPSMLRYEIHRAELERNLCTSDTSGTSALPIADREVIVSLTSYSRRVEQVHVTIESLMRQTVKPNRIILWLDDSWNHNNLPTALLLQMRRGLEVRFCPDYRSYKKLIPTLQQFPDAIIITADDDIVYDASMIDRLIRAHRRFPNCIVTNSAFRLVSDTSYSAGHNDSSILSPALDLLPYGGNGTLYPPGSLHPDVTDWRLINELCPSADDIWFKAMSMRMGTLVARTMTPHPEGWDYISSTEVQDIGLWHDNVRNARNDDQYAAVMRHFNLTINP